MVVQNNNSKKIAEGKGTGKATTTTTDKKNALVSPRSKFQAAASAVKDSKSQKSAVTATVAAMPPGRRLKTESTSNQSLTLSTKFTKAKTEGNVSPKSKFRAAAFAIGGQRKRIGHISGENGIGIEEEKKDEDGNSNNNNNHKDNLVTIHTTTVDQKPQLPDPKVDNWAKVAYASKVTALAAKNERAANDSKLVHRIVITADTWDIWSPPPQNTVSGKVIPRLINKHKNRRKISLEIHRVTTELNPNSTREEQKEKDGNTNKNKPKEEKKYIYHESVLRMLAPATKELSRQYKIEAVKNLRNTEGSATSSDSIREIKFSFNDDDDNENDEDGSIGSSSTSNNTNTTNGNFKNYPTADRGGKSFEGWKPKYSIPMYGLYIRGYNNKKTVHILISFNNFKQEREIIFDTLSDAKLFIKQIEKQKRLENKRQDERLTAALGGEITLPKFETLILLFEIVSAYDIPIGDYTTSDPYVTAYMGHQELHRTKVLPRTLNPIWTLKTGSLFLLSVESKRLFIEEGIQFVLKDHDKIGAHDTLGIVKVEPKILYQAKGERLEYKLQPPPGSDKNKKVPGILVVRCRRATQNDQKFMNEYTKKGDGMKGFAAYKPPETNTNVFTTISTKVKKKDKETGAMLVRF